MLVTPAVIQGRIPQTAWRADLRRETRTAIGSADKPLLAAGFARQRSLFRNLLLKIEGLADLACLQRPGFQLISELAREARNSARRTERELELGADPDHPYSPSAELIEQLIEQSSDLQDRLQRQLALAARWQEDAVELQHQFDLLIGQRQSAGGGLAFDGVRDLVRRLISDLPYDVIPPVLHPQVSLDLLAERFSSLSQIHVFAVALASAQVVARVARVTWLREDRVELVTAAALLQDCGKLLVQAKVERAVAVGEQAPTLHRHARIGAAIISHYRDAPLELPRLIADHHRRLHGTQTLPITRRDECSQFCNLVAAASRLERLRILHADQSTLLTRPERVDQAAMSQLWRETIAGNWDLNLVRKILVQRDGYQECMAEAVAAGTISRPRVAQRACA